MYLLLLLLAWGLPVWTAFLDLTPASAASGVAQGHLSPDQCTPPTPRRRFPSCPCVVAKVLSAPSDGERWGGGCSSRLVGSLCPGCGPSLAVPTAAASPICGDHRPICGDHRPACGVHRPICEHYRPICMDNRSAHEDHSGRGW